MSSRLGWIVRRAATAPFNKSQLCLALHSCADLSVSAYTATPTAPESLGATIRATLPYCDTSETAIIARGLATPCVTRWATDSRLHLAVASAALAIPPGHADNIDAVSWALLSCVCGPLFGASPSFISLRTRLREALRSVAEVKKLSTSVLLNAAEALSWATRGDEGHAADLGLYRHLAMRLRAMKRPEDAGRCLVILRWSCPDVFAGRSLPPDPPGLPQGTVELLFGKQAARPVANASLPPALLIECAAAWLNKMAPESADWSSAAESCVKLCQETLACSSFAEDPAVVRSIERCRASLHHRAAEVSLPESRRRVVLPLTTPPTAPSTSSSNDSSASTAGSSTDPLDADSRWAAQAALAAEAMTHIMNPSPTVETLLAAWRCVAELQSLNALDDRLAATAVALTETMSKSPARPWPVDVADALRDTIEMARINDQWRSRSRRAVDAAAGTGADNASSPQPLSSSSSDAAALATAPLATRIDAALDTVRTTGFVDPELLAELQQYCKAWSDDSTTPSSSATAHRTIAAALYVLAQCGALAAAKAPWSDVERSLRAAPRDWSPEALARVVASASLGRHTSAEGETATDADSCRHAATAALIAALSKAPHAAVGVIKALLPVQRLADSLLVACTDAVAECRSALPAEDLFEATTCLHVLATRLQDSGRDEDGGASAVRLRVRDLVAAVARDATPPEDFCRSLRLPQLAGLLESAGIMKRIPRGLIDTVCRHIVAELAAAAGAEQQQQVSEGAKPPLTPALSFELGRRLLAALNDLYVPRNEAIEQLEKRLMAQMETTAHVAAMLSCVTAQTPKDVASALFVAAAEGVVEATPFELKALTEGLTKRPESVGLDADGVRRLAEQALERLVVIAEGGTRVTADGVLSVLRAAVLTKAHIDGKRVMLVVEWLAGDGIGLLDGPSTVDVLKFLAAAGITDADYAHALTSRLVHFADTLDTTLLSDGVFALSQCGGYYSIPLQQLADIVVDRASDFCRARPMIRLLHGFSKMGVMHRGAFNSIAARLKLRPVLHSATVADAAVALDAFSGAKYLDETVFTALSGRIAERLSECGAIDLALTAQSHSDLYVVNGPLFNSLADRAIEIATSPKEELPVGAAVRLLEAFGASGVEREDCAEAVVKRTINDHQASLTAETTLRLVGALCDMQYSGEGLDLLAPLVVQHMESYNSVDLKELTVMLSILNWRDDQVLRAIGDHAVRLHAEEALEPLTARCVLDTLQHFLHSHSIARAQLSDSARTVSRVVLPDDQPIASKALDDSSDNKKRNALA